MIIDLFNDNWFYVTIENDDWKFGWGRKIKDIIDTIPRSDKQWFFKEKRWAVQMKYRSLFNPYYRESLESADDELNQFMAQFKEAS